MEQVLSQSFGNARRMAPGLLLCAAIAAVALVGAQWVGAPTVIALIIGLVLHRLSSLPAVKPGLAVAARQVLRFGVVLVGARITADQILELGPMPVLVAVVSVVVTLVAARLLAPLFGMPRHLAWITGGAVGICGASAALAVASAMPQRPETERDLAVTIGIMTLLSTTAMLLYPALALLLGMDPATAGILLGGTIHDVAQVTGAGYAYSVEAGDVAVFTKLLRVAMLVPVVVVIAALVAREAAREGGAAEGGKRPAFPLFVLGFAALVVINSLGLVPAAAVGPLTLISQICLVMAIAAIGLRLSLKEVAARGWRHPVLMLLQTLILLGTVLALLALTGAF